VLGSRNLADAADRYKVKHFVMISTDKAINPTNIMGASKRVAEIYVQALSGKSQTRFVTVRFGNVLGSNGSVVPIFQEQILKGGPVTVTDRRVTRFFMTIPEAVQLVMQAGSMGQGGEIFILNMGEQIEILHLAEELIRLSGMTPYEDIDIVFTGLRPGEKLYEELRLANENVLKTGHNEIYVVQACQHDITALNRSIERLSVACRAMDHSLVLSIIKEIVPEFASETRSQDSNFIKMRDISPKVIRLPRNSVETA
jgi:FlaA1/EpsC-like NDP-sugar epimerase